MAARKNSVHSTEDVVAGFRDPLEVLNHSTKCETAWKLCTLTLCPIPAPKPLGIDCSWCLTFRLGTFQQPLLPSRHHYCSLIEKAQSSIVTLLADDCLSFLTSWPQLNFLSPTSLHSPHKVSDTTLLPHSLCVSLSWTSLSGRAPPHPCKSLQNSSTCGPSWIQSALFPAAIPAFRSDDSIQGFVVLVDVCPFSKCLPFIIKL